MGPLLCLKNASVMAALGLREPNLSLSLLVAKLFQTLDDRLKKEFCDLLVAMCIRVFHF